MSWRDRDYNLDGPGGGGSRFWAILAGSVPLGRWFGIRVRVHASMLWVVGLTILLSAGENYALADRAISMALLFGIVLLHEFGHCFAARAVGGTADDILMWPLGGLATTNPPNRPLPSFLTVAGGPAVNVLICALTGAALWYLTGQLVSFNPFQPMPPAEFYLTSAAFYLWWIFSISYILLLFNLLPIFPLDGGQILQTALWPVVGQYRSLHYSCVTGIVGAIGLAGYGLVSGHLLLLFVAIAGFIFCYQRLTMLKEVGAEGLQEAVDFSASLQEEPPPRRHLSKRFIRKARRLAAKERAEQARIDAILEKVSATGLASLTWREKRALRQATQRQRQRDMELTQNT